MTYRTLLKRAAVTTLGSVAVMSLPITAAGAMERVTSTEPSLPNSGLDLADGRDDTRKETKCKDWIFNGWGDCDQFIADCKGHVHDTTDDPWYISTEVTCHDQD